jgi:hypothetical protein
VSGLGQEGVRRALLLDPSLGREAFPSVCCRPFVAVRSVYELRSKSRLFMVLRTHIAINNLLEGAAPQGKCCPFFSWHVHLLSFRWNWV